MYIISTTVGYYFEIIHNMRMDNSNALEVLDTLKRFEKIHLEYKTEFTPFRGVQYNTILEMVQQAISKIEKSHIEYKNRGNIITVNTKQYDIAKACNNYQVLDREVLSVISEATKEGLRDYFKPVKKKNKVADDSLQRIELNNLKKLSKK